MKNTLGRVASPSFFLASTPTIVELDTPNPGIDIVDIEPD